MKDIDKVIYDLSIYLITFDFGWDLEVKSNQDLYLINNASYDTSFMNT